eukprot:TRINITY_DN3974_c0_g1_i1.p1 TRINITY_DN3974_c0_g1~~TRINITY_DN3974_c0_g1_i1.p1  ORF type:complete len:272 (+),score=55.27 TRINITY_DN3974_c0_g1_i1:209-1024(+)
MARESRLKKSKMNRKTRLLKKVKKIVEKMGDGESVKDLARKDQKVLQKLGKVAAGISKKGISEGWAWENDRTQKSDDVFDYFKGKPIPDSARGFGFQTNREKVASSKPATTAVRKAQNSPGAVAKVHSPQNTPSRRKMAYLKKKAETFAKSTASLLTGEFIQHRCRKKLRLCEKRLQKHLKILRQCEKSKEGDNAPCWQEVKETNELVMKDFARCRELRSSCSGSSLKKKEKGLIADTVDPCSFLDEFDPDKEAKCDHLKKRNRKKGEEIH